MNNDKARSSGYVKHIPKDAQVIMSVMKDMGINDYDPKVINQLLEFTYRYVTCILDESKTYANHSKKKFIDVDDVTLAVKLQLERAFTNPPPRDVLIDVAKTKNAIPLPIVKPSSGLRLPPDRFCLIGTNYKLKSPMRKNIKSGYGHSTVFGNQNKRGNLTLVKRPGTLSSLAKSHSLSMSKPMYKYCPSTNSNSRVSNPQQIVTPSQNTSITKMETEDSITIKKEENGLNYDGP